MKIYAKPVRYKVDKEAYRKKIEVVPFVNDYGYGRNALNELIEELGYCQGSNILIPEYYCNSGLDKLRLKKHNLHFIPIDENLTVSIEKIKSIFEIQKIDMYISVYYFGITPYNLDKIYKVCRIHNVRIIEDHCHSFLNLVQKKIYNGDVCARFFSMRKILPVKNGAGYMARNQVINFKTVDQKNSEIIKIIIRRGVSQIKNLLINLIPINPYGNKITKVRKKISNSYNKKEKNIDYNINRSSHRGISLTFTTRQLNLWSLRRRENYNRIFSSIKNLDINTNYKLFELNDVDVPQVLPIYDQSESLEKFLRKHSIGAYSWPKNDLPYEVYLNQGTKNVAINYSRKMVCIPVHQDLTNDQLNYIEYIINLWARSLK